MNDKQQSRLTMLVAAMLIPRVQKLTGLQLTSDDVAALMVLVLMSWHGVENLINRWLPAPPAKEKDK